MLVLLSIYQAPIGQVLSILASDWLIRVQILLHLIRHLRGLRGFKLTFSTFYRVSSLAQRNLESHKNARYDISMTVQLIVIAEVKGAWWQPSDAQHQGIFQNLNMTYFIVTCHSALLWHKPHFLPLTQNVMKKGFRLLSWLPVLYLISKPEKNIKSQKPLTNFKLQFPSQVLW